ncbi:hypothetical protein NC653_020362 [Populus alba x Populus x berolinensis]|uniref:Uncharacterized protein n=1 Tax=Populus alba x Populus x berolinensis TaxID=444605 RepID=A0AAD6QCB5_9ROSI|nr:hypothetical protein NC653_020362 [Populus alba x Populus x berolinensis]
MIIKREGLSGIFNKTHLDLEVKNDGKKGRHKRRRSRHSESKALQKILCLENGEVIRQRPDNRRDGIHR